ncbi:MAG TPA: polysaccharide biosynthesis/export family protein [Blastocatellia bacterium]|nr:polysaccharide biosynthesis/export family protein [Blastocatellia bacterium]
MSNRVVSAVMIAFVACWAGAPASSAQDLTKFVSAGPNDTRPRTVKKNNADAATDKRPLNSTEVISSSEEAAIQAQINSVYQNFYNAYRLGPGDIIGIYIDKHPEDSVERVTVSPVGKVYFPLLGNVTVVGKTLPQLQEYFSTAVAEYIREPRLTLSLLEAQSAKIGVLGDVKSPGVQVMTRPLRVLDAITQAGGILETGSQSVSILRQYEDGRAQVLAVDVKKILKGKANPEENAYLRSGDTVIVHGNLFKKIGKVSSVVGITTLVTFLTRGGR